MNLDVYIGAHVLVCTQVGPLLIFKFPCGVGYTSISSVIFKHHHNIII